MGSNAGSRLSGSGSCNGTSVFHSLLFGFNARSHFLGLDTAAKQENKCGQQADPGTVRKPRVTSLEK